MAERKRKKIDHEALQSTFMQLPSMKVEIARGLLDSGIKNSYELIGRAPEVIIDGILTAQPQLKALPDLKARIQLAIYYAETSEPEPQKLKLSYWIELS
jgi:hypothetical protein